MRDIKTWHREHRGGSGPFSWDSVLKRDVTFRRTIEQIFRRSNSLNQATEPKKVCCVRGNFLRPCCLHGCISKQLTMYIYKAKLISILKMKIV